MGPEEIAAESIVLKSLNKEQRQCLAGIAAASLPDDDLQDNMWNSTLFLVVIRALSLDEDQVSVRLARFIRQDEKKKKKKKYIYITGSLWVVVQT